MQPRLFLLAAVLALAGCNSPTKTAEKGAEDEYVLVHVTGSNVPKRVKKSDLVKGEVVKDSDTQVIDKDDFAKSMRTGRQIDRNTR